MQAAVPVGKSSALVFCDMAGTMRLFAQEGDLVASTVLREFVEHTGRLGREHHCLMIKFIFDSFLAAFDNINDVMPFVISIQNLLSTNPTFVGRVSGFHLSLHYGNVVFVETSYGSEVLGEAVNIVALLNEVARHLAQPYEVVVSQAALERMPGDFQARAGASESHQFKRVGNVEFRRVNLLGS